MSETRPTFADAPTVLRPEYVVVGGDDDVVTFWHDYDKAEKFVRAYGGTIEAIPDVTSDTDPYGDGEEE